MKSNTGLSSRYYAAGPSGDTDRSNLECSLPVTYQSTGSFCTGWKREQKGTYWEEKETNGVTPDREEPPQKENATELHFLSCLWRLAFVGLSSRSMLIVSGVTKRGLIPMNVSRREAAEVVKENLPCYYYVERAAVAVGE